jgi:hypothetical protein
VGRFGTDRALAEAAGNAIAPAGCVAALHGVVLRQELIGVFVYGSLLLSGCLLRLS